jgi:hypothetical protein
MFLDADDIILGGGSSELLAALDDSSVDIIATVQSSSSRNKTAPFPALETNYANPSTLVTAGPTGTPWLYSGLHHQSMIWSKDFLASMESRYGQELRGQDLVFMARAISKSPRIRFLNECIYAHQSHGSSRTLSVDALLSYFSSFFEAAQIFKDSGSKSAQFLFLVINFSRFKRNLSSLHPSAELATFQTTYRNMVLSCLADQTVLGTVRELGDPWRRHIETVLPKVSSLNKLTVSSGSNDREIDALKKRIELVESSLSYKVGRTITWAPRAIHHLMQIRLK